LAEFRKLSGAALSIGVPFETPVTTDATGMAGALYSQAKGRLTMPSKFQRAADPIANRGGFAVE
jgi:hypothetical protein